MCYTIKRSSFSIMQIDKKEESQINGIDQTRSRPDPGRELAHTKGRIT